jgi:hypothetical protein
VALRDTEGPCEPSLMIVCQRCRAENPPGGERCKACGRNLLQEWRSPGAIVAWIVPTALAVLVTFGALANGLRGSGGWLGFGIVFGILTLSVIAYLVRSTLNGVGGLKFAPWERYERRAFRHEDADPEQALADHDRAVELAPAALRVRALSKRAALYERLGMTEAVDADRRKMIDGLTEKIEAASGEVRARMLDDRAGLYERLGDTQQTATDRREATRIRLEATFAAEAKASDKGKKAALFVAGGDSAFAEGFAGSARTDALQKRLRMVADGSVQVSAFCRKCGSQVRATTAPDGRTKLRLTCPAGHKTKHLKDAVYSVAEGPAPTA